MCVGGWRGGLGTEMLHETINIALNRYYLSRPNISIFMKVQCLVIDTTCTTDVTENTSLPEALT